MRCVPAQHVHRAPSLLPRESATASVLHWRLLVGPLVALYLSVDDAVLPCVFLSERFGSLASVVHMLCRAWAQSCLPELLHLFVQEGALFFHQEGALSCRGEANVMPRDALQLTTAAGRISYR